MNRTLSSEPVIIAEPFNHVAVFGGIYNNYLALEAAIQDARQRGAEAMFCLGDIGGFGPHPDRSITLLREHGVHVMRGNYDEAVALGQGDCGCGYTDPRDNEFAQASYDYTFNHTNDENKEWLRTLPPRFRFKLGSTRIETCHGSPRQINEFLWESATPQGLIERFLGELEADVLLCTHTGIKWKRLLPENRGIVNVGALGRPENDGTTQVWYASLRADANGGWNSEFIPIRYDAERLAAEMRSEQLPEEFIKTVLTGWWTTCLEILPAKERLTGRF